MVAFLVKWVGVIICTLIAYSLFLNYISAASVKLGHSTFTYAFFFAAGFFILGARVTAKSK